MVENILDGGISSPARTALRAGGLTLFYEDGTLRYIKAGGVEVVRQIYAALRDHNWGTIVPVLNNVQMDIQPDSFRITYTAEHRQNDIDFSWQGTITGTAESVITFDFDGVAHSSFLRNRIGFCILHPMDVAGQDCTLEHVDGSETRGQFPKLIAPHQPYFDLRAIRHHANGVEVEVRMEGDTFEMEDQRNWIDASYKTYCTPLATGFPRQVNAGDRIHQTITVRVVNGEPAVINNEGAVRISVSDEAVRGGFRIGLGMSSVTPTLTPAAIERLKALHLSHLRADLDLNDPSHADVLRRATEQATALNIRLELALFINDEAGLQTFRALLDAVKPAVMQWLIFAHGHLSTPAEIVTMARSILSDYAPDAPFGAGTNAFFTELNRQRLSVETADFLTYSVNPQVHAFDNPTLIETMSVLAETVRTARAFSGGKGAAVSPLTFKMRWNPNATGADAPTPAGTLPPQVDARQMSLFAAGYTLGSLKYLAAEAHSATLYETVGWRGVMDTEVGSPAPFPAIPGGVFPMYHIFADLGEYLNPEQGGEMLTAHSSDGLRVEVVALRRGSDQRVLIANLTDRLQNVSLHGLHGSFEMHILDSSSAVRAVTRPESFRAEAGEQITLSMDGLTLPLLPFSVIRLDKI